MRKAYDVVVVGGGIMGVSAAKECARMIKRRGAVALIDQFDTTSHSHGSSHGDGRIFRLAYRDPLYVEMAKRSWVGWETLQSEHKEKLFSQCGGVDIGMINQEQITGLQDTLRSCGVPHDTLDSKQLQHKFPQFAIREDMCAVYQPGAASLFADRCRTAFTNSGKALGVDVLPNTKALSFIPSEHDVVIQLNGQDRITAHRVILAAGAWTNQLLSSVNYRIPYRVSGEMVCYYRPKTSTSIDHSYRSMPTFLCHLDSRLNAEGYYGLPQIDIPGVKAATHHTGPTVDPDNRDKNHPRHAEMLRETNRLVQEIFPHLEPTPFQTVHCMYSITPDQDFVLDRLPQHPNISVAAGFSGHGFKFAPVIGEIMAKLALERVSDLPLDKFSISRFK